MTDKNLYHVEVRHGHVGYVLADSMEDIFDKYSDDIVKRIELETTTVKEI